MRQARWWILTIPADDFEPVLPPTCDYLRGQRETGEGGYEHWQLVAHFPLKKSLRAVKEVFGDTAHCEPTRSKAALDYVWKDDTAVANTRFQLGQKPFDHADERDWQDVWAQASRGNLLDIPADVRVRCYNALARIQTDFLEPKPIEKEVHVFWGASGTGKTRRAFEEAGPEAYWKDPATHWWSGYTNQSTVILDDFRGKIPIEQLLRLLDRYPMQVEVKGGARALCATRFYITSNLAPRDWYMVLDPETERALLRRLTTITHFE